MANFDNVRLGDWDVDADDLPGFHVQPGTRHMREAPAFIERFSTGEISHRADSFWQHWVMAGFRGGIGQDIFTDVEMVKEMVGFDGTRDGELRPFMGFDQKLAPAGTTGIAAMTWRPRRFATVTDDADINNADKVRELWAADVYGTLAAPAKVYWSSDHGATWSNKSLDTAAADTYQGVTSMTYFQPGTTHKGYVVMGTRNGDIWIRDFDTLIEANKWKKLANTPLEVGRAVTAMVVFGNKLYVSQNNKVWAWSGRADARDKWTTAPVLEADVHFSCATVWNGAMYWGGYQSYHGKLYRVDGAVGVEVATFADNFTIQSVHPYDGSLFIGGAMYDEDKQRHVGRIYRFNGSSLKELDLGKAGIKRQAAFMHGVWDMAVWEGMLLFPAADFVGICAYDAAEDAFYRLPRLTNAAPVNLNEEMCYNIAVFEGVPYLSVPAHGIYKYNHLTLADSSYTLAYFFDTSMFEAGVPMTDKLFWEVVAVCDDWAPGSTDYIDVSYRTTDDGAWVSLGTIDINDQTLQFPDQGMLARGLQLRFDFSFTNDQPDFKFKGFHVRYLVEPRVRRNWSLTLVCADRIERRDGTMEPRTGKQMRDELWALRAARKPVKFIDVDGMQYLVCVAQAAEYQQSINQDDGFEAVVSVQLWEA